MASGNAGNFQSIPALKPDQVPIPTTLGSVNMYMNLDDNLNIWTVDRFKVHRPVSAGVTPAYGNFYVLGDGFGGAFFPGYLSPQFSSWNQQNNQGIQLANFDAQSGGAIVVEKAGLYLVNYNLGSPEESPTSNNSSYAIAINQALVPAIFTPHPGTKITNNNISAPPNPFRLIMGGSVIVSLPDSGQIQIRSLSVNPSIVHSWASDSIAVSISVTSVG